jgi:hypothetical protein
MRERESERERECLCERKKEGDSKVEKDGKKTEKWTEEQIERAL